jgi:hypothetical protein
MAVRLHNERDKRHPKRVRRSEYLLQDEEIADDSLVITVCYEAHLAMQKMLTVFAEMRGDDAEGPN